MALAFTPVASRKDVGRSVTDITLDASSYSTGFAVTPANLGMIDAPDIVNVVGQTGTTMAEVVFHYDAPNAKIRAFRQGAAAGVLTEAVNTDFATTDKIRVEAVGRPVL